MEVDRAFIVSDLHMQDGEKDDPFKPNAEAFIRFLDYVKNNLLILNGDIFDLWRTDLFHIVRAYPEVVKKILTKNFIYLYGNHDRKMSVFGNPVLPKLECNGFTIMHGDVLDMALDGKPERKLARYVSYISGKIGDYTPLIGKLEKFLLQGHRMNEPYINKLIKDYPSGRYIIGHSHTPDVFGLMEWFYSDGSWGVDQSGLTYIELNQRVASIKYWE